MEVRFFFFHLNNVITTNIIIDTKIAKLMMTFLITVESLTCIGNWTSNDGQRRYLIGSLDVPFVTRLEDKIRCFLYKDTNSGGWKLSQSSSPSCDHLRSFQSGYRNFHLKKGKDYRIVIDLVVKLENTSNTLV